MYCTDCKCLLSSESSHCCGLQVGRAGRFGTKGLAITFVSSPSDSNVLNQVRDRYALLQMQGIMCV